MQHFSCATHGKAHMEIVPPRVVGRFARIICRMCEREKFLAGK